MTGWRERVSKFSALSTGLNLWKLLFYCMFCVMVDEISENSFDFNSFF